MADYKGIKGFTVQSLATDPLTGGGAAGGTWSSGGNVNTARNTQGSAGTQTANLIFGGNPTIASTEKYDGSSWTEVNDLNTGRQLEEKLEV